MAEERRLLLRMEQIDKRFPGVHALDHVDFDLYEGEIHVLLGENGAGKSTLMKILSGAVSRDSGRIWIGGREGLVEVSDLTPERTKALGIGMVYQELSLVPYLSVAENIFLGGLPRTRWGAVDWAQTYHRAWQRLQDLGVSIDPRAQVRELSVAEQQLTEIARVLESHPRILVLDEPTSALSDTERTRLFELIRRLRDRGVGIIYISHRLEEVFAIAQRVTVLRDGRHVGTRPIGAVDRDELIRMMVGRELAGTSPKKVVARGAPVLEVRGLTRRGAFSDVSFTVHAGEVLGIGGLVGAGRTEVARALFGADPIDAGEIRLDGQPVLIRSPRDAIRLGLGLVPEDRKTLGLILNMVVRENVTLAHLDLLSMLGFVNRRRERDLAAEYVRSLRIRTPTIEQEVRHLSGGNQQKVVLAKWLCTDSRVMIFDEPTRGIDVGAKQEIYELMNELAARGVAMIMITSELPELLAMSDRILVMHAGRVAGELSREEATQERVMHLATGGE